MNRKIKIEMTIRQSAEILRNAIIQDAKFKPNGYLCSIEVDSLVDQIKEQATKEESDYIVGVVTEVDKEIRLTTKN